MKVNVYMPRYMADFSCISSSCVDSCCEGWDINIDEISYKNYINSSGDLKLLLDGKFIKNKNEDDYFNHGYMILEEESKCPFLNSNMLCKIHGGFGEENLCITCKSYPRVINLVDEIHEKSGLPSCYEICLKAFLNKEKMEFIEVEEEIDIENIEIRRIIDSEAFDGTESLLQYFWDIRVISINIIQNREFSIEERLNILNDFYKKIDILHKNMDFDKIEELLDGYSSEEMECESLKGDPFTYTEEFYLSLCKDELFEKVRSIRLHQCIEEYRTGITNPIDNKTIHAQLENFSYIIENYLVNQIFKNLVPFNRGGELIESSKILINSYRIIKSYILGIAKNYSSEIIEEDIIRVIQAFSKDAEHNKVFKELLES